MKLIPGRQKTAEGVETPQIQHTHAQDSTQQSDLLSGEVLAAHPRFVGMSDERQ